MSIKVVKGIAAEIRPPLTELKPNHSPTYEALRINATLPPQQQLSTSEVVQFSSRVLKGNAPTAEKIREYKEAKEVAEDLADKVRDDGGPDGAHSDLTPVSGTKYLL